MRFRIRRQELAEWLNNRLDVNYFEVGDEVIVKRFESLEKMEEYKHKKTLIEPIRRYTDTAYVEILKNWEKFILIVPLVMVEKEEEYVKGFVEGMLNGEEIISVEEVEE